MRRLDGGHGQEIVRRGRGSCRRGEVERRRVFAVAEAVGDPTQVCWPDAGGVRFVICSHHDWAPIGGGR